MTSNQAASHSEAQEAMLRSPETVTDWVSAKCRGVDQVSPCAVIRDVTAADFTSWTVGRLDALSRDAGQPALTRLAAIDAINAKFLNDPDIERQTDQFALQIEERRAKQEREDRIEAAEERGDLPVLALVARFGGEA